MNYKQAAEQLSAYEYLEGYYSPWKMFVYSEEVSDESLDWMVANIEPFNFVEEDLTSYFQRKHILEDMVAILRQLSYRDRLRAVRSICP